MKVLFVFEDINAEHLGAMYLSAVLKENGHEAEVVYADYSSVTAKLDASKPVILAYSTLAFYNEYYIKLNKKIKNDFKIFSLFGGHYPTSYPEIIEQGGVDAVCMGEGEYTLLELADKLESGENIENIKGTWIKVGNNIIKNPLRPLIDDLDQLPLADRLLFRKKAPFFRERASVITGRGCIYRCPYCYNSTMKRLYPNSEYRRRSVDNVIKEIQQLKNDQSIRFILFHDDIFIHPVSWLEEFSEKYARLCNIPFNCYVRIDMLNSGIVQLLKDAGCYSVSFGIESADEFLRKSTYKRSMDKKKIIDSSRMLKKSGIRMRTTNMIGAPESTINADLETLKLNIKCRVDFAKVGILAAYPGTDISPQVGEKGIWSGFHKIRPPFFIRMLKLITPNLVNKYERLILSFSGPQYSKRTESDKRMVVNMKVLFPVVVGLPFLLPAMGLLLKLPINIFFVLSNYIWDNYCTYFRIYSTGIIGFLRGFLIKDR